ncbi:MAG: hypothetical protein V3T86_02020 [Planctomycetota bacterium]
MALQPEFKFVGDDLSKIIECVANVSEGRDSQLVAELVAAADGNAGARCVNCESDVDHNRSVLTILGESTAVGDAAIALVERAVWSIDLAKHDGVHPRGGAVDVLPFVPLQWTNVRECESLAKRVADHLSAIGIPTALYGHGQSPLPEVRATRPETAAGVTCVGAREILIAFNVNLESTDLAAARAIAKSVRERDGGLPAVRALGFALSSKGCVQVSMNLLDYRVTGIEQAFLAVRDLAAQAGIDLRESELIGLAPEAAWPNASEASASVRNFTPEKLIEFWL